MGVRLNPIVLEMQRNWKQYGFENALEATGYTVWVARYGMAAHLLDGDPLADVGYNGLRDAAGMLRRYPVDEYRLMTNRDIAATGRFETTEDALAYLLEDSFAASRLQPMRLAAKVTEADGTVREFDDPAALVAYLAKV